MSRENDDPLWIRINDTRQPCQSAPDTYRQFSHPSHTLISGCAGSYFTTVAWGRFIFVDSDERRGHRTAQSDCPGRSWSRPVPDAGCPANWLGLMIDMGTLRPVARSTPERQKLEGRVRRAGASRSGRSPGALTIR